MKRILTWAMVIGSLILTAAIFGFFYAWVCSTMWGLDAADPRVAIQAMQAMNGSVRNGVFAPAFFGAPIALLATGVVLWLQQARASGVLFCLAGAVSLGLGVVLTAIVHIPMNEALAILEAPQEREAAAQTWDAYSPKWQLWNQIRTGTTCAALIIALIGTLVIPDSVKRG